MSRIQNAKSPICSKKNFRCFIYWQNFRDNCTSTIKGDYGLNHCNFILTISILPCIFPFFLSTHTLIKALYLVTLRCGAAFLILEKRNSKKMFLFEMRLFNTLKLSRQYSSIIFCLGKKEKHFERMKNMYWFRRCLEWE